MSLHYSAPITHPSHHVYKVRYERSSSPSTGSTTSSSCGSGPSRLMLPSQSTEDILRTIMKVRKSWKTLKGHTEPVWPPYLEATMLKGLHEYKPVDSRETQILGRFPMRNRFISEYIYHKTGMYRSSKQIGSRLQQFRDTSEGRELIDSLTRCYLSTRSEFGSSRRFSLHNHVFEGESKSPFSYLSFDSSSSDSSSTTSSTGSSIYSAEYTHSPPDMPSRQNPPDNRTPVYIDILPESSSFSSSSSSRSRAPSSSTYKPPQGAAASLNTPRRMRDIDPTVTFVSPSAFIGKSSYIVLLDGAPIHSEDTKLECVGPYFTGSSGDGPLLYSTALVPKYWETLCKSPDPTVYTIIQDVYRAPDPATPTRSLGRPRPVLIFSATYHLRYPAPVRAPQSSISPHFAYQANSPFLANNAHAYPDMINPIRPLPFQNYAMTPGLSEPGRFQSHEYNTQNRLDEPFILDVSLENFSLDDFMINLHDSPEATSNDMMAQSSSSSFPKDIRNYIM
ncbi:hypothetical protein DEU56DRAFT_864478 [Suillus clintonianus]|uniref:uncharacterized protein n=1 Tax=Suillus clintonianus TaxID=1904413 RepID=UPI001B87AF77|nr:uncharacterized protein DEU56DRAFT_864478 [Suillus clintonianus]KAG2122329.1 hypothetical protein DEU56DRAFT_864478 [Suillus clintonianus]